MLEMYLRLTHLRTTNTRSNAYWMQHDVQHYRMKYDVYRTFPNPHQKGCSKKSAFKMDSVQMKTKRIIQKFKLSSCNIHFNRYFYFITLLLAR